MQEDDETAPKHLLALKALQLGPESRLTPLATRRRAAQVVVQEDEETALEHLLDLKAQHFHLGLLKVTKKDRRKPGRRKAEPEAEGRDAEAAGELTTTCTAFWCLSGEKLGVKLRAEMLRQQVGWAVLGLPARCLNSRNAWQSLLPSSPPFITTLKAAWPMERGTPGRHVSMPSCHSTRGLHSHGLQQAPEKGTVQRGCSGCAWIPRGKP